MPDVQPFRAIRYAHPTDALVAPPYDVIDETHQTELRARDPHNVVHLTLADDAAQAARLVQGWLDNGVLVRDDDLSAWVVTQDYIGPDGVARRRTGVVASLRVEPYATGAVLPHERTHAGPKEGRLRLLRATGIQLEPIFLLYDGAAITTPPDCDADLEAGATRLWRVNGTELREFFADRQLLIADGHHRYETAVEYALETAGLHDRMMVVLVATEDPGLEIFATHRVFSGRADIALSGERFATADAAVEALAAESYDRSVAVLVTADAALLVHGVSGELDVELVDRFGHEGVAYTADTADAVGRVERGEADCAFLLRATRIEDVFDRARRGKVMPQKTTYFFPKLTSGLLFHPT